MISKDLVHHKVNVYHYHVINNSVIKGILPSILIQRKKQ